KALPLGYDILPKALPLGYDILPKALPLGYDILPFQGVGRFLLLLIIHYYTEKHGEDTEIH
ncbi:MAG: hypothetical protein LBV46_01250, partial [Bacteroidales bacterium]|nr:hypothetical protein [Bacteroidales bacterium]